MCQLWLPGYSKWFIYISSLNPPNSTLWTWSCIIISFYRWRTQGTKRLGNLSRVSLWEGDLEFDPDDLASETVLKHHTLWLLRCRWGKSYYNPFIEEKVSSVKTSNLPTHQRQSQDSNSHLPVPSSGFFPLPTITSSQESRQDVIYEKWEKVPGELGICREFLKTKRLERAFVNHMIMNWSYV